jgi:tetratricopeptide (TPR) repeat protein
VAAFVGRAQVLGDLQRFVAEATKGSGGLVLVAGEPGIGKTSLIAELAARCTGVHAVWGSCWEGEGAPALWPWIQILRELARKRPVARDQGMLGRLVPELGEAVPAAEQIDEHTRFLLFDAVAAFLSSSARSAPLLLVLDDLHWADTSTLLLLGFLIPELRKARIAVVGTYRDVEVPAGHVLHRILSARSALVRLTGLERVEVADLVRLVTSADPSAKIAEEIHRATGGNPFFVREMLRFQEAATLPDSVGEAIRRRVERLSPECRTLLSAASVVGQRVRLDVLARVVTMEPFAEALGARLMEEDDAALGTVRFPHAVVREVLYRDLRPDQRMALHRRVGEALETLSADEAELAHHFAQSALLGTASKAVEYAEKAGQRALAMLAYDEAAAHFDRALALLPSTEEARRAELLIGLGRATRAAGRAEQSHAALERAAQLAVKPELLATAALEFGIEFTAGIVDQAEVRLLEQALTVLPAGDQPLRARVLARLAKVLLFTPAITRRSELSETAAAMARRIGDPATLAAVLYDRHVAIWGGANVEERLSIANEVVELAERCRDTELSLRARALRLGNLLELGDVASLQVEIEAYDHLTTRLRQPHYLWHVPLLRATQAAFACRFDAAEQLAEEGLALGRRTHHQGVTVFHPAVIANIRFIQGRFVEMEPILRRIAEQWPSIATSRCALSYTFVELGRDEEARQELERLTASQLVNVPRDFTWVANLAFLSLAAAGLEDRRAAEMLYGLLLPYRAYCVRLTRIGIAGLGAVEHFLGLLSAARHSWAEAAKHFERAIEINQRIGAPAFVANSRYHYGRVLSALGETVRAKEELDRAENAATTLGFRLVLRRFDKRSEAVAREGLFQREGEYFTVRYRGPTFRLKESLGVEYIARLLSVHDRELHVLDLSGAPIDSSDGTPILDARAKADFRRRLADLEEEAEEAEARGELDRAGRAREEIEALAEQLSQAVGLGGRDRHAASQVERARVRVTKAIKAGIRRIAQQDRALADHLEHSIRTGVFCSYAPDPAVRIVWRT